MAAENGKFRTAFVILMIALAVLALGMLVSLAAADIPNAASEPECIQLPFDSIEAVDPDAPTGTAVRYSLTVPEQFSHAAYLAFYTAHQSVRVYLDGNCVFSLEPSGSIPNIKTPGCNWIMIPIARENIGGKMLVEIVPVYACARESIPVFLYGSERAIVMKQLISDLPQLLISLLTVMTGLIILAAVGCSLVTNINGKGLLTLGLYAVLLGLWRFLGMKLLPMLFPGHTVLLFYLSVTMLMLCPVPLTSSLMEWYPEKSKSILGLYRMATIIAFLAQMLLQLLGIADLGETLVLSRILFIIGVVILITNSIINWIQNPTARWDSSEMISCILILGVLTDLLIYYWKGASFGLLFTMLAFLCLVIYVGTAFVVHYREQEKLLAKKEEQITQSRVTATMGQIRSHFIFNVLNAISGMCKYDPEKADETIICFARYLRANIDMMRDDRPVMFHSALQHLEDYIALEQIRFGDRIRFVTDISQEHFMLPSMILQPIVENAIKHGLTPKPSGGTITLRTWTDGDDIKISIQDDGVGFHVDSVDESKSVGLQNVRFRLRHMMDGDLRIESDPGCGTTVTIILPQHGQK